MSIVQWLLLILVIAVVAGAYWYLRRQSENDPWSDMEDDADADEALENGEALSGDSYIVGVRTISSETPASRKAASGRSTSQGAGEPAATELSDEAAEASWAAYKHAPPEDEPPPLQETSVGEQSSRRQPAPRASGAASAAATGERMDDIRGPHAPAGEQEIFILHVASPDGRFFDGPDIHAALQGQKLKFGLNNIYHRVTETNGVPESVFSIANMLKPGSLDPIEQDHLATPGLTLFLVLPGPLEGVPAMRDMMETANGVASALGGEVLDDKRALLKAQTAQYMLDQIAELDRRARIARRR